MARRAPTPAGARDRSAIESRGACRSAWTASAAAALAVLSGGAAADPPPTSGSPAQSAPPSGSAGLETVTIEARRHRELIERQISAFVSSITIPFRDESLARWQVPICPMVDGLTQNQGEFVLARLLRVARDAGIPLALQDCKAANFIVIVTRKPDALLQRWWAHNPRLFNTDRGVGGIKRFIGSTQPVRAWYNAYSSCPDGAMPFDIGGGPMCSNGGSGSRLTWGVVRVVDSVIVVVDAERITGFNLGQVTDYIAMLGLAQIREHAKPGAAPTILHLFADSPADRLEGLSSWDQAFLRALYHTDSGSVMQRAEINLLMDRDLVP